MLTYEALGEHCIDALQTQRFGPHPMTEVGQSMQIEADRGLSVALGKQRFDVRGDGGTERAVIEFLAARKSRQACPRRVRRPGKQADYAITKPGTGELSIISDCG